MVRQLAGRSLPSAPITIGKEQPATAPAKGCAAPHNKFCTAIASENASRPQPRSNDSGDRNWPSAERGPNAISAIAQPTATSTAGVRQDGSFTGAAVIDMKGSGKKIAR